MLSYVRMKHFVLRKSKQKLNNKAEAEEQGTKNPSLEANLVLGFFVSRTRALCVSMFALEIRARRVNDHD